MRLQLAAILPGVCIGASATGLIRCLFVTDWSAWSNRSGDNDSYPVQCRFLLSRCLISALTATLIMAGLTAPKGIGQYIRQHFLDTTFRGLYRVNAFDLWLLIP